MIYDSMMIYDMDLKSFYTEKNMAAWIVWTPAAFPQCNPKVSWQRVGNSSEGSKGVSTSAMAPKSLCSQRFQS